MHGVWVGKSEHAVEGRSRHAERLWDKLGDHTAFWTSEIRSVEIICRLLSWWILLDIVFLTAHPLSLRRRTELFLSLKAKQFLTYKVKACESWKFPKFSTVLLDVFAQKIWRNSGVAPFPPPLGGFFSRKTSSRKNPPKSSVFDKIPMPIPVSFF